MRAFVISGPGQASVQEVDPPRAGPGQVVVDIARAGVCGTDVELFTGEMAYFQQGHSHYPLRPGHEWSGTVSAVADDVDSAWVGRRVTGDTFVGCGHCRRCLAGRHHVCDDRVEIGILGAPGALAEQLAIAALALHALPDSVDDAAGAMVEPGGNALRAVRGAHLSAGDRVLILGAGAIGLLAALFARAQAADVHIVGRSARSLDFARTLGFTSVWPADEVPRLPWDAVIDASNDPALPILALELVEPGKRVVFIGLAGVPSLIDTRTLAFKDMTAVGILGASAGLAGTIEHYAAGEVNPNPLVAATVRLDQVGDVLAGWRPDRAGLGPKIHVDPRQ